MKPMTSRWCSVLTLLASVWMIHAHEHLNAGAASPPTPGTPLIFFNGDDFATESDYVLTLRRATTGTYAGYYEGELSMTVLPATPPLGGPEVGAPTLGSFVHVELVSVSGPVGGVFSFWEDGATTPTHSLASGQVGTNRWVLSENNGVAGTDPFGHIHDRRWTATQPGIYCVGFRLLDLSTNGTGGGSIHTPSAIFTMCFQAGVNVESVSRNGNMTRVRFSTPWFEPNGSSWRLQSAPSPNGPWQNISGTLTGDDHFHELDDATATGPERYYRLRGTVS